MPGFIYALMGTCPQLVDGSTGLTGILVAEFALLDPAYAVFMSLVNGVVITLLAVFRLGNRCLIVVRGKRESFRILISVWTTGFFVDFFSVPVMSAFVSAAAIAIPASQVQLHRAK